MDLVKNVESHLGAKNFDAARTEILRPENLSSIQSEEMELISKLCDLGLHEAVSDEEIGACSQALEHIARNSNPKLALVSILEQAESFLFSTKFRVVLSSLQILLSRDTLKRPKLYSWSLEILNKHMKQFQEFPVELNNVLCEGKETLVLEQEPKIMKILEFYKDVCAFFEPLLKDYVVSRNQVYATSMSASTEADAEALASIKKRGEIFRSNLIELLGTPLIYFDLSWNKPNEEQILTKNPASKIKESEANAKTKIKTEARLIAEKLMGFLSDVNLDSAYYMKWIDRYVKVKALSNPNTESDDDEEENEKIRDEDENRIQITSIGNYLYLVYVEDLSPNQMPMAYFPAYLFHTQLPIINALLYEKLQNYAVIHKGLSLAAKLISGLNQPLESDIATHEAYDTFVKKLIQLIVFCDSKPVRQLGLKVLTNFFLAFDPRGKYMFLQRIWSTVDHSGLRGYMIGQLKDLVISALQSSEPQNEEMRSYFLGDKLLAILAQFCRLSDGPTTDLMRTSDEVIAVLNLVRFMLIRDGVRNESKFLDGMKKIETEFLKPLRTGLDYSKAHYKLRLKELNDPAFRKGKKPESDIEMAFIVEGKEVELDDIPVEQQIMSIQGALAVFDVMESLLARVNECYSKCISSRAK